LLNEKAPNLLREMLMHVIIHNFFSINSSF